MSDEPVRSAGAASEHRQDPRLRSVFDDAFAMIEPFFDLRQGWSGRSLEHLAYRIVRDNFPELSPEEVHTVLVVAHRLYIERHPDESAHLPRPEDLRPIRP